ncbi:hypothetical protein J6590_011088 [Homalodisca vitripennis]|nr:hypothetical protein J6590_011088 [Homalodisca vitripennis]
MRAQRQYGNTSSRGRIVLPTYCSCQWRFEQCGARITPTSMWQHSQSWTHSTTNLLFLSMAFWCGANNVNGNTPSRGRIVLNCSCQWRFEERRHNEQSQYGDTASPGRIALPPVPVCRVLNNEGTKSIWRHCQSRTHSTTNCSCLWRLQQRRKNVNMATLPSVAQCAMEWPVSEWPF